MDESELRTLVENYDDIARRLLTEVPIDDDEIASEPWYIDAVEDGIFFHYEVSRIGSHAPPDIGQCKFTMADVISIIQSTASQKHEMIKVSCLVDRCIYCINGNCTNQNEILIDQEDGCLSKEW